MQPLPHLDIYSLTIQSVVHEPVMGAAWESLLEMQVLDHTPDPLNQQLHFKKIPRGWVCTFKSEEPWSIVLKLLSTSLDVVWYSSQTDLSVGLILSKRLYVL